MTKKRGFREIKYIPLFDQLITTANREQASASGLILTDSTGSKGKLLTTQVVLKCGSNVPEFIQPGTTVELNMDTFKRTMVKRAAHDVGPDVYEVIPPLFEEEDGSEFMHMSVRNLLYVIGED